MSLPPTQSAGAFSDSDVAALKDAFNELDTASQGEQASLVQDNKSLKEHPQSESGERPKVQQDDSPEPEECWQLHPDIPPPYEIINGDLTRAELGRGKMGVVFKVRHKESRKIFALKMIQTSSSVGAGELARFEKEAMALARMKDGNIVELYDVGKHQDKPFFIMEFVDGCTLTDRLKGKRLNVIEAAELVITLAYALQKAHEEGFIHRDLKPDNVLLAHDGTPKIIDFGLAKNLDDPGLTQSGVILGTPIYMAPEQALGNKDEIGPKVDIYSLGAILYEMLTGRPPFVGISVMNTLLKAQAGELVSPRKLKPDLPIALETICLNCLGKNPNQRYAAATDLANDLRRGLAGESIRRIKNPGGSKRHPGIAALVIIAIVVLVPLVWFLGKGLVEVKKESFNVLKDESINKTVAKQGEEVTNSIEMKLVFIPPGTFSMGSSKEEQEKAQGEIVKLSGRKMPVEWLRHEGPEHIVEITKGFYLGVYEVTQGEYEKVMNNNPTYFSSNQDGKAKVAGLDTSRFPVGNVSYVKAEEFCRKLSELPEEKQQNRLYRLPTEAEWEYACRGGVSNNHKTPFYFGISLSNLQANFQSSHRGTLEVGSYKQPNGFGLYDMHGNVDEWCSDWYAPAYYDISPKCDPKGPPEGWCRVFRGGGFRSFGQSCRSAFRGSFKPDDSSGTLGIRVALIPLGTE